MKKFFTMALCMLATSSFAQLTINPKIYQQVNEGVSNNVLRKELGTTYPETYMYTISGVREFESNVNFDVSKMDNFSRFTSRKKKIQRSGFLIDAKIREFVVKDVKSILPKDITDSCAITSISYEYEQRDYNQPKIVGSFVMFHRLLENIPVRGSSYILASYDSTGNLSYMDVQWDKYNKIPAKSTVTLERNIKTYRNEFEKLVEEISLDFKQNNLRGSIDKSVQSFMTVDNENGSSYLVPSVTFIGKYSMKENDDSVPMVFDIPTNASLVPLSKTIVSK